MRRPADAAVWLAVVVPAALAAGGCSSAWDAYPESLYDVLKGGEPRTIAAHHELLKRIVDDAESRGARPPAGITAEYAYYSWKMGQPEVAKEALAKEVQHYPQSQQFVAILARFLPSVPVVEHASELEP